FSKGGFESLPVVFAGKLLGIPVIIHESDSVPGRANLYAGKIATKVALSFAEASSFFDKDKIDLTGNPLRRDVIHPITEGAREFLKLEEGLQTILILGGSLGAAHINETIVECL